MHLLVDARAGVGSEKGTRAVPAEKGIRVYLYIIVAPLQIVEQVPDKAPKNRNNHDRNTT